MLYPRLQKKNTDRRMLSAFRGYEHRLRTSQGAFYETKNLSSSLYPLLSVRPRRAVYKTLSAPQGMIEKDALAYIDGGCLYYNGLPTALTGIAAGEKQLVSMGAYICIFPDKLYYNTEDPADYGSMEAGWDYTGAVSYTMCNAEGEDYPAPDTGTEEPANPNDGDCWLNTASNTLSIYGGGMWTQIESVYVKLRFTTQGQIPAAFARYDGVELTGSSVEAVNGSKILQAVGGSAGTAPDYADAEGDYIVVIAAPGIYTAVESESIHLTRAVPDMDFVCQCANRLWGCRYGNDGTRNINELYCCALGDFKNWSQYLGLSTDSWRASVGSNGVWTGAVSYLGEPLFFKENCIHRVSVSSIGAHQVGETLCRGVQKGSAKSLCVVNETLYYKSRSDVCAYQGGFPESVSAALGEERYSAAVAGAFGQKYYISMLDAAGEAQLFALDIARGIWMHEDGLRADAFARVDDELFCLSGTTLYAINGTTGTPEGAVSWQAETGLIGCEYPKAKYLSRVYIRAWLGEGAQMKLYIEYDSSGEWQEAGELKSDKIGTAELSLRLHRCDHVRLRLTGQGEMKLISAARELTVG